MLRRELVGSLLDVLSTNLRQGREDIAIFEIGKGYGRDADATREWWRLGLAITGAFEEPAWNRPRRPADLDDAKGVIELVCHRLGFDDPTYSRLDGEPLLHPGRAARVSATRDGAVALSGVVGELHPTIGDQVDLRGARLLVAELDIAGLGGGRPTDVRASTPSRHPAAERDIAVVVAESEPAAAVETAIRGSAGPALTSVRLFDIYRGAPLADTDKSLAWHLVFQADDRTLTDAEIEDSVGAITAAVRQIGGRIRT